jgi:ArsR family metal-binding transcriptional regulator
MILKEYREEIFHPKCNSNFQSLHCIAHLDGDIREVLAYLNSSLGGDTCTKEPPSVTFRVHGKLVTVHHDRIAINALKDEDEADKILEWLKQEINHAWKYRKMIKPRLEGFSKSMILEVLKLLPRSNCQQCAGRPAWYLRFWLPTAPKTLKIAQSYRIPIKPTWKSTSPDSAPNYDFSPRDNL